MKYYVANKDSFIIRCINEYSMNGNLKVVPDNLIQKGDCLDVFTSYDKALDFLHVHQILNCE